MSGAALDAGYWYANVREQVRFADAVVDLAQNGYGTFVEVSAQPVLTGAITECVEESGAAAPAVTGTITREEPGPAGLLTSLARLHVAGASVDWRAVLGGGERVELPTYAFQNRRYWLQVPEAAAKTDSGHNSEAEAEFWAAVEGGDAERLAGTLSVDDETLAEILPALASWRRRERADSAVAGWRYKVTWAPVSDPGTSMLSGTWLVVHPAQADAVTEQCVKTLTEHGADVVKLQLGDTDLDRDAITARLTQIAAGDHTLAGIVSLLALDEAPNPRFPAVPTGLAGSLLLTQALGDADISARLWIITQDAVVAAPGDRLTHPIQGQAWGFGRVVGLEHPERWGGLLDLPLEWDDRIAARYCAVLSGISFEDQIAVRAAGILGRRLVRPPKHRELKTWQPRGTVLITGGTGALGGHVGRWLTGRGAGRIVLTSRSGPGARDVAGLAAELANAGTSVEVAACDASQRSEVSALLARIAASGPALSSVVHTAGVGQATVLAETSLAEQASVTAPKTGGAAVLDELTADLDLDAFVMFSSIAATWGGGMQPSCAAGNAYLDALAENRRAGAGRDVGGVGAVGRRRDDRRRRCRAAGAARVAADGAAAGGAGAGRGAGLRRGAADRRR